MSMLDRGTMVRGPGGSQMKFLGSHQGIGRCAYIDHDGRIIYRHHYMDHLERMTDAMQPRSLWPQTTQFDHVAIEAEERAASDTKRRQRKAKKKSNRIKKTRDPVMA